MDEILYLEADEEITSVIDKVKKAGGQSIGLVVPRNSSLAHSIVNLKLLKKEAAKGSREISLITPDKTARNIASQIGIQVYEDVNAKRALNPLTMPELPKGDEVIEVNMSDGQSDTSTSQTFKVKHYDPSKSKTKVEEKSEPARARGQYESSSPSSAHLPAIGLGRGEKKPVKITALLISLALIILGGTLLGLPQSTVVVTIAAEPFEKTIATTIDKSTTNVDSVSKVIPGKMLEYTNDDARRIPATGKKDVGTKAKGAITISNSYDSNPVKFTAGTTVTSSENKGFALVNDVTVPGATAALSQGQLVINPGKANVDVVASEAGEAYNIKPSKFTISGLTGEKQTKITAESSKDFTGGLTKQVTIMTQTDIDTAKDTIVKDLNTSAIEQLHKEAKSQKLIEEAISHEITTVETNPQTADSETDYFDIKVKMKHQVIVFDDKVINDVVTSALKQEVPSDKELLLGEGDQFVVKVASTDYAVGKLNLESSIKTKIGASVDAKTVKQGLAGKSQEAIRGQITNLRDFKDLTFHKFPSWWWQDTSYLPWNTRVKIIYE